MDDSFRRQRVAHKLYKNRIFEMQFVNTYKFKHLMFVIQNSGEINGYVTHHTQSNWHKWRAATGVLCDRKLSIRLKGKFY